VPGGKVRTAHPSYFAMGLMQVECPAGAGAGQRIKIVANGAEYEVEVPAGVVAGQTFQIEGADRDRGHTMSVDKIAPVPAKRPAPPDRIQLSVDPASPWMPSDEILEEFFFDDELTRQFFSDKERCEATGLAVLFPPAAPCTMITCSLADVNAADFAYSRWVAVSKENIYIVRRKRKADWRFDCCDINESRKTIPINNVQDIMINEPAAYAAWCCFVPNVLTSVAIETAGTGGAMGGGDPRVDPSFGMLQGLLDPQRFRNVVLNLKKGIYIEPGGGTRAVGAPPAVDSLGRTLGALGLPAAGTLATAAAASPAIGGSAMEQYLAEMVGVLHNIDQNLFHIRSRVPDRLFTGPCSS